MFIVLIIGCALLLDGVKAIYRYFILNTQWKESQVWPSTTGKIIRSNIKAVRVADRKGLRYTVPRTRMAYIPDIVYNYCANGEVFESGQLYFAQNSYCTSEVANERIEQYPVDSEVTVYYNPEKPEMALLDRNRDSEISSTLFSGMICLMIGLLMVMVALGKMLAG